MLIYHGGYCAVIAPEIRDSKHNKDFGQGFYCTALGTHQIAFCTPCALDCLKYLESYEVA
jgi:hypothetical protein